MRINSLNLQTYAQVDALRRAPEPPAPEPAKPRDPKIANARFLDVLNAQEVSFLRKHFVQADKQAAPSTGSEHRPRLGGRIDVTA